MDTMDLYQQALHGGKSPKKRMFCGSLSFLLIAEGGFSTKQLKKDFQNAAYTIIRSFVLKFEELGSLHAVKYGSRTNLIENDNPTVTLRTESFKTNAPFEFPIFRNTLTVTSPSEPTRTGNPLKGFLVPDDDPPTLGLSLLSTPDERPSHHICRLSGQDNPPPAAATSSVRIAAMGAISLCA
ncbi:hypothetical protein [Anaerotruncus rubiinfantis]|uniref:hypothetical protein n=1 Tax=Anaerotruncus rubiinfantis TaxID=1720200 RepID=UPI0034A364FE